MEKIESIYEKYLECSGVNTDTRSIQQDELFFALKGPNFNGNQYAEQALQSGAKYAVVDDPELEENTNFIQVSDSLGALQELAKYHREQFDIPVLGLTGSNGKTTTKELTNSVLSKKYKVHCTAGNLNNHIGVPLTLLAMKHDAEIAVIEMGANHLGEIASYCQIAQPTHGIITNIGTAHIGEFGGQENLIRAKSELFDYLRKTNGTVFINKEDVVLSNMARRFQKPVFFPDEKVTLKKSTPFIEYLDDNGDLHQTQLVGKYNFQNAAAALAIGRLFGVEDSLAYQAIDSFSSNNNRSQLVTLGSNTVILDAYNANPDSCKVALESLAAFDTPKKLAFLGDMKELGEYSSSSHLEIFRASRKLGIPGFFVGKEYDEALRNEDAKTFLTLAELTEWLKQNPISNSTVLLKGSRSMTIEKLTETKEIWN